VTNREADMYCVVSGHTAEIGEWW